MAESNLPLKDWETFYFFVGTSAAALIGLQFVVIALVGETGGGAGEETLAAFGTPTVTHLCAVVLVAALLVAPWTSLETPGILVAIAGFVGIAYAALTIWRARQQEGYDPVFEDWLFHAILPVASYGSTAAAGLYVVRHHPVAGLVVLAAATLLLLFVAIHNAWDTATYIAVKRAPQARQEQGNDRNGGGSDGGDDGGRR